MMNEEGFVFIKGRLKDMIITGGQNVHAAEVEEILLGIPGVADCAVFGLPDELWGERVAALIVKSPDGGDALTAESVEAACASDWRASRRRARSSFRSNPCLARQPERCRSSCWSSVSAAKVDRRLWTSPRSDARCLTKRHSIPPLKEMRGVEPRISRPVHRKSETGTAILASARLHRALTSPSRGCMQAWMSAAR